jgi:8-amino-7-oxononanoate synthase
VVAGDDADGEHLVFASNNYLGLATDERVGDAAAAAARSVGTGAGASRLLTGDTALHHAFEADLAAAKGTDDALLFSSGYAANVGTIAALDPDVVCSDALNHASIVDGCRLADAETVVYDHADPDDLDRRLRERRRGASAAARPDGDERVLIVTDSVFSMGGDVAPLGAICDVAERHGAWTMVDEAHATGLYADGGGIVGREALSDRVDVQIGTCSKALASQGGFVAGSEPLVDALVNFARSFVFSTGLTPPAVGAAREAFRIARETDRRDRLWDRVDALRDGLTAAGFDVPGETQIRPVRVGDPDRAVALSDALRDRGVLAPAIRPPTVPDGDSRVRVAPMATHTAADVEGCLDAFRDAGAEVGVP